MGALRRASSGYLGRHPWQLLLALAGICIGVAVMVAVDLANSSARRAFLMSMDAVNGSATHQLVGGPRGVPETLYSRLRVTHGFRGIAPVVEGEVRVGDSVLRLLGVDVFAEREFRNYTVPAGGEAQAVVTGSYRGPDRGIVASLLTDPATALLSPRTAARIGLAAGDGFTVAAAGGLHAAQVTALIGDSDDSRLDDLLVTDIATAQQWLGKAGFLTRIDVRADDAAMRERLQDLLPPGVTLLTAEGRTRSLAAMSDAFMTNLTAMSLLALLVGLFLIYNSVSFAVVQRRELFGTLRALGVTRQGVLLLVLAEAAVLGVCGALLGLGAGMLLGEQLLTLVSRSINDLYFALRATDVAATPASLARGFAAGVGAALLAAAVPAIEASARAPRRALARSDLEARAGRSLPYLAALGVVVVLLAGLTIVASGRSLVAGLVAVFLLITGCALVLPLGVRLLVKGIMPIAASVSARLAVSGVTASLSRTGVAIVALSIAVSASVGVTIMVDSFRAAVGDWLNETLRSDLYVSAGAAGLEPDLVADLVELPGVVAWSSSRRVWLESAQGRVRVTALRLPAAGKAGVSLLEGEPRQAWAEFERGDALFVSDAYSYRHGVRAGDSVALPTASGRRDFAVAGVYRSYDAELDTLLLSRRGYDRHWDDPGIDSIGLYLGAGVAEKELRAALAATAAGRQALSVRSDRDLRELTMRIFDRTFVITDVLYWLTVGVAVIGILSALLALQLERAREYATLRALGMTPGQLAGLVTGQAGVIGLLAGLAALPLGLLMAAMLVHVINRRAFGWQMELLVAAKPLAIAVLLATVAGAIAGLYPAWRAARVRPASAMREE